MSCDWNETRCIICKKKESHPISIDINGFYYCEGIKDTEEGG